RIAGRNRHAALVALSGQKSNFQLKIEIITRRKNWAVGTIGDQLPLRTMNVRTADYNRAGTSVITNRQMLPVRFERIFWPAEHRSYIPSVLLGGIKIGVIAYLYRQLHFHILSW